MLLAVYSCTNWSCFAHMMAISFKTDTAGSSLQAESDFRRNDFLGRLSLVYRGFDVDKPVSYSIAGAMNISYYVEPFSCSIGNLSGVGFLKGMLDQSASSTLPKRIEQCAQSVLFKQEDKPQCDGLLLNIPLDNQHSLYSFALYPWTGNHGYSGCGFAYAFFDNILTIAYADRQSTFISTGTSIDYRSQALGPLMLMQYVWKYPSTEIFPEGTIDISANITSGLSIPSGFCCGMDYEIGIDVPYVRFEYRRTYTPQMNISLDSIAYGAKEIRLGNETIKLHVRSECWSGTTTFEQTIYSASPYAYQAQRRSDVLSLQIGFTHKSYSIATHVKTKKNWSVRGESSITSSYSVDGSYSGLRWKTIASAEVSFIDYKDVKLAVGCTLKSKEGLTIQTKLAYASGRAVLSAAVFWEIGVGKLDLAASIDERKTYSFSLTTDR